MQEDQRRTFAEDGIAYLRITTLEAVHRSCQRSGSTLHGHQLGEIGLGTGNLLACRWSGHDFGFLGHDDPAGNIRDDPGQKSAEHRDDSPE